MPLMQQQNALSQNQAANQANSANAFGGSRQGVQQGVAQAQGAMNIGQMAAQLNQANYTQAQQGAQYDITNNQQAQIANQQANQANINSLLQAGSGLGTLGSQAQTNQRQQFLEESTAGAGEQAQAQNQITANMNQFNQAQAYPGQQLGILQSALGMTPYGSTTMGSSTGQTQQTTTPSLMSDVTGGLQALGSLSSSPFGAQLGSFLTGSDSHLKTDITPVGVHAPTGLPLYSYRYKGDPKSFPKVTGPMAEDVMQVAPHAVRTMGVHAPTGQALHGVDMGALNMAGPVPGSSPGMGANDNMAGPMNDNGPAIRPRRMPGANGAFSTRVPGPLAPTSPDRADRRDGGQHAATAHAAERAHAARRRSDGGRVQWLTRTAIAKPGSICSTPNWRSAASARPPRRARLPGSWARAALTSTPPRSTAKTPAVAAAASGNGTVGG